MGFLWRSASMYQFHQVGILGRLENQSTRDTFERLTRFLEEKGIAFAVESALQSGLSATYTFLERVELAAKSDLIIVVGGDGTLLGAARDVTSANVPVLGVNRGRLGFLTDIMPEDLEIRLEEVFAGKYVEERRFLLEVEVSRNGTVIDRAIALNDVVLHPGQSIRMLEFELLIDDQFVYSQRSDGLIVSTPTGSTAYALSAGGPIMHPKLNAIVLVPMFPHTLTSRPLVVDGDRKICIRIGNNNDLSPQVSCDAQSHINTQEGDELIIRKMQQTLHLLHPPQYNFYETCRTKLGWGSRLGLDQTDNDTE